MTLDEAIEHAKELASTCDDRQCAADHAQLAEWLRQARGAKKASRWFTSKIRELEEENAKLREEIEAAKHDLQAFSMRYVQLDAENDKLREFVQSVADGVYEDLPCCDNCRFFDGCYNDAKKEHDGRGCQWLLWARELGIEADYGKTDHV